MCRCGATQVPNNWKFSKPQKYVGPLADQVVLPALKVKLFAYSGVNYVRKSREHVQIVVPQFKAKLPLLFEHFGIDGDSAHKWEQLAKSLAQAHVPGFQVRRAEGARKKITAKLLRRLLDYVDVERAKRPATRLATIFREPSFVEKFPEFKNVTAQHLANVISKARTEFRKRDEQIRRVGEYLRNNPPFHNKG